VEEVTQDTVPSEAAGSQPPAESAVDGQSVDSASTQDVDATSAEPTETPTDDRMTPLEKLQSDRDKARAELERAKMEADFYKQQFESAKGQPKPQPQPQQETDPVKALDDEMLKDPKHQRYLSRLKKKLEEGDITQEDAIDMWEDKRALYSATKRAEAAEQAARHSQQVAQVGTLVETAFTEANVQSDEREAVIEKMNSFGMDTNNAALATVDPGALRAIIEVSRDSVRLARQTANPQPQRKPMPQPAAMSASGGNAVPEPTGPPRSLKEVTLKHKREAGLI